MTITQNTRPVHWLAGLYLCASLLLSPTCFADTTTFETNWGDFTSSTAYKFYRIQGATPSSGTGPSSGAEGSKYYVYFETSGGASYYSGNTAYLTSSTITASHLSFYYHMYGANIGTLAVEVLDGSRWSRIWQLSGQQQTSSSANWVKQTLALSLNPEPHQVRFVAMAVGGYRGDIALDQIRFENPTAPSVQYHYDELGRLTVVEDQLFGDKSYEYDPAGNRTVLNGNSGVSVANSPPLAKNDYVSLHGLYSSAGVNVLSNDTDPDGDPLTVVSIKNSDGRFSVFDAGGGYLNVTVGYSSTSSFTSGFTYTVSDGINSSTGTVTVSYSSY